MTKHGRNGPAGRRSAWSAAIPRMLTVGALALGSALGAASPARADEPSGLTEEVVDEATRKADADYRNGVHATKLGKNSEAIAFFERALPKKHDSADIFYNLVQVTRLERAWDKVALYGQAFLMLERETKDASGIARDVDRALETLAKRERPAVDIRIVVPEGARAFVDEAPVADHDHPVVRLAVGSYALRVEKEDHHPFAVPLVVAAADGPVKTVEAKLERIIHHGKVTITSDPPAGVQVFVDGTRIGETPLPGPLELESGKKILLRFEKLGFEPWVRYVELGKNETMAVTPKLEKIAAPFVPPATPGPKTKAP
ncbi:MAG: PEGA domain-containing protein [Myxococcota bacterium]